MTLRVLEVLASLRRAGAERIAVSIACGLDKARFHAEVVSLYPPFPGGLEPELAAHGVPVAHFGKRRGFDPRMWPRLATAFRRFRPDIIHTHSYVLNYVLPAWASARGGTVVHTVHNLAEEERGALGRLVHRAAFRAGVLPVAVSLEVARSFERVYGFKPVGTIPNGVVLGSQTGLEGSEAGLGRPGAHWRRANGFSPDEFLVVSVARFEPQKNPLGLIEAFAQALPSMGAAKLAMAGEGSLLEPARRLAGKLGVTESVRFLGLRSDVPEMLAACDLFALASAWEGAPVAVVEAMAGGLPVVATAVGGVPGLVEDGVSGILVPPGDAAALAAALAKLAHDPQRRGAMGEAAFHRAAEFEAHDMVDRYAALFQRLAGGPAR